MKTVSLFLAALAISFLSACASAPTFTYEGGDGRPDSGTAPGNAGSTGHANNTPGGVSSRH